jgi:hypothetical protein
VSLDRVKDINNGQPPAGHHIGCDCVAYKFTLRQRVWSEPIYRNVWGLLEEFGDAELATLVAPRALIVEFNRVRKYRVTRGLGRLQL